jgi:hypothetical protein
VNILKVQGHVVNIKLNTLSSTQEQTRSKIVDLTVMSVDGKVVMKLSNVYVVKEIPVNMPALVDVRAYSHLYDLPLFFDGPVDLLIGQRHSEALIPLETRRGREGEPFAVKTLFGWSVNGPVSVVNHLSKRVVSNFITTSHVDTDTDIQSVREVGDEDDCLRSTKSEEEAISIIQDTGAALANGSFNLTKFVVNSDALLQQIPEDIKATEVKDLSEDMHNKDANKEHLSWDEPLPSGLQSKWYSWISSLDDLTSFKIPRCVKPAEFDDSCIELHHFSDASLRAYGTC